jgi:hypothetical protein
MSQKSPRLCEQLLTSIKQPPKRQQWLNYPEFFQFIETLIQSNPLSSSFYPQEMRGNIQRHRKQSELQGDLYSRIVIFTCLRERTGILRRCWLKWWVFAGGDRERRGGVRESWPVTKPQAMPEVVKCVSVQVKKHKSVL